MSLEVDEKLFGVMRFLLAAVKSLPDTNRDIFTVECLGDEMRITIIADCRKVGHISEYVDNTE